MNFQQVTFPYTGPYLLVRTNQGRFIIDFDNKQLVWSQSVKENAANEDWNKHSRHLAYTLSNNLFVTTNDGKTIQVTNEPEGIVCGQSVHRNEFGIEKGTFWSPSGKLLAFYRMDETMVTDYPQVNTATRIATLEPQKYPMAGMTSHKVTVGIFNPASGTTIYLQAGDPTDRYFTNISWTPDEKKIFVIELNRDQNHAEIVRYDAATGIREDLVYEERHDKYVEPQHPLEFLPWDNKTCVYQSRKDGYNHLYLLNTATNEMKQLTHGEWEVQELIGFNSSAKEILILSTETSPLQSNVFAVETKTGATHLLGYEGGTHQVNLCSNGKYLIDSYVSHSIPHNIDVLSSNHKRQKPVNLFAAENPYKDYAMPEISVGTLKAADGMTDLYYRLVKPLNFNPNKKYPAIIYVYGGPHAQMIKDRMNYGISGWDIYMAQEGYVMLTVDSRGSANRGLAFENVIFRQLGVEEMKDQMKGVDFLRELGFVDMNRLGIHGWSYGGFMTTNLMLTHNDVFKVAVAGGPVIDWSYYEVMYGERYMDTPQQNPDGYKNADLKQKAGRLKGRLDIVIGGNDPTCVPQHSISFLRSCIDAGTHPDFFVYPGDGHNMRGLDRVHLYEHVTRYFMEHLN